MVPLWANMTGIADGEKEAFNTHILICSACAEEYEETKELMSLVKAHWGPISSETRKLLEKAAYEIEEKLPQTRRMTVEEGWQDLLRRCPDLAENTKRPKSLRLFIHIGAAAACFIIGILAWIVFSKPQTVPQTSFPQQVAAIPASSVKIELVKPAGNIAISDNKIITDNELKTLLINGKHKMALNAGTNVSIEPLTINSNLGCLVKLNSGEIYTHVEHDGNPFIVQTPNGKAIITGTTFDIKAEDNKTTLIVSEGCVQLQSEEDEVSVGAGQLSQIVDDSAPALPLKCDVSSLTAWATGQKSDSMLAKAKTDNDISWQPPLSTLRPEPIELDKTDYKYWVEEKREWFSRNFPWIFELKDALAKEGIEADYPELLIQTGDVWQFMCLDKSGMPAKFSIADFESLLKTSAYYSFDKEWLLEKVPSAKIVHIKSLFSEIPTGLTAFELWLKYTNGAEVAPSPYYSADACKYLAETRSLIWFAVNDRKFHLADNQRTKVLNLLQQEITTAYICRNDLIFIFDKPEEALCGENVQKNSNIKMIDGIRAMKAIEEKIAEFRRNN